jgi:hypothetical protein
MNRHRPEEMRFFKEAVFNYKLYEPGELDPEGISKVFFTCESMSICCRWSRRSTPAGAIA